MVITWWLCQKRTHKSVEPDQQQFYFVLQKAEDDSVSGSLESVKTKLLSIANKQLNRNTALTVESEQSLNELDLQAHNSQSTCEESLMVLIEGSMT